MICGNPQQIPFADIVSVHVPGHPAGIPLRRHLWIRPTWVFACPDVSDQGQDPPKKLVGFQPITSLKKICASL